MDEFEESIVRVLSLKVQCILVIKKYGCCLDSRIHTMDIAQVIIDHLRNPDLLGYTRTYWRVSNVYDAFVFLYLSQRKDQGIDIYISATNDNYFHYFKPYPDQFSIMHKKEIQCMYYDTTTTFFNTCIRDCTTGNVIIPRFKYIYREIQGTIIQECFTKDFFKEMKDIGIVLDKMGTTFVQRQL